MQEKNKYGLISLYNGMSTQAKIVLGLCGVFVASATVFVVYDSLSEKTVRILVYLKKCNLSTDHRKQHGIRSMRRALSCTMDNQISSG